MEERNKQIIVNFFNKMLDVYEFELLIDINEDRESVFKLKDMLKANLGNIEQEEFYSLGDIINRLDIYHNDYIYTPLEDRKFNKEKIKKDDWDMVAKEYLESETVEKILSEIQPTEYKELANNKADFSIKDMINILKEDEKFYKNICQKYVNTMSKEMIIKTKKNILHIYIEDDYIDLKEDRKINKKNFRKYLDKNFEVYHYETYKEFFDAYIKNEIAYDVRDLGLMEDEEWSFYISFEELKRIGYGYMIKEYYPLLIKYAIPNEKIYEFFEYFSLEQLNDFENTLYLLFESNDIEYDKETLEPYSKSNKNFNRNIICLAKRATNYEDFISTYIEDSKTKKNDLVSIIVREYYKENNIRNLEDYRDDDNDNSYHFTDLYKDLLKRLDIKYECVFTEEKEPGEYTTTVEFDVNNKYCVDTKGYADICNVAHNLDLIGTKYKNYIQKQKEREISIEEVSI